MEVSKLTVCGKTIYDAQKEKDKVVLEVEKAQSEYESAETALENFKSENEELLKEFGALKRNFNASKAELAEWLLKYYELNKDVGEDKE